ncbi:unnamed protein product, partial [Ectocarpus sp. 6 AP-2014]
DRDSLICWSPRSSGGSVVCVCVFLVARVSRHRLPLRNFQGGARAGALTLFCCVAFTPARPCRLLLLLLLYPACSALLGEVSPRPTGATSLSTRTAAAVLAG